MSSSKTDSVDRWTTAAGAHFLFFIMLSCHRSAGCLWSKTSLDHFTNCLIRVKGRGKAKVLNLKRPQIEKVKCLKTLYSVVISPLCLTPSFCTWKCQYQMYSIMYHGPLRLYTGRSSLRSSKLGRHSRHLCCLCPVLPDLSTGNTLDVLALRNQHLRCRPRGLHLPTHQPIHCFRQSCLDLVVLLGVIIPRDSRKDLADETCKKTQK